MIHLLHAQIKRIVDFGIVLLTSTTGIPNIANLFGMLTSMVPKCIHRCILSAKRPVRGGLLMLGLYHLAVLFEDVYSKLRQSDQIGRDAIKFTIAVKN